MFNVNVENHVLLQRNLSMMVPKTSSTKIQPTTRIATFLKNFEALGYTFAPEVVDSLYYVNLEDLRSLYKSTMKTLKELKGAHVQHSPMYPNFPEEVMEMEESELYFNAVVHYIGTMFGMKILPDIEKLPREELSEEYNPEVVSFATETDMYSMYQNILGAKSALSEKDKTDVKAFCSRNPKEVENIVPVKIEFKEILAFFTDLVLRNDDIPNSVLTRAFKTATDVLRLAISMSNGDETLKVKPKFKNFSRKERRMFIALLNNVGPTAVDDMMRYRTWWIRLGEKLHPGDYKDKYSKTYSYFDKIRNDSNYMTYNAKIEESVKSGKVFQAVKMLKKRPGDFARRLDKLIRDTKNPMDVVNQFGEVASQVSTNVLLQLKQHFLRRNEVSTRIFIPKGKIAKAIVKSNDFDKIDSKVVTRVIDICENTLVNRWKELTSLGNVYIDSALKDYVLPMSQRSASTSSKTVTRGSKIPFTEGTKILRFFIYWNHYCDIDLSCQFLSESWKSLAMCSFTALRDKYFQAFHSGDITDGSGGSNEFIDINVEKALEGGARYVIANVYMYRGPQFNELKDAFFGWMERKELGNKGEIFEPKTVKNKIDLTTETRTAIPVIIDLQERKVIWCDFTNKDTAGLQMIENFECENAEFIEAFIGCNKPNFYDLLSLHALARGNIVENIEDADTVFSVDEGIQFQIDDIRANYMV